MPQWSDEEQRFARDFQKSAGREVIGLNTAVTPLGGRAQSYASNDSGDISWTVPAGRVGSFSAKATDCPA